MPKSKFFQTLSDSFFQELERAYRDLVGRPIPFRSLGFGDVVLFLESIPDVVELQRLTNGDLLAKAKADEKDSHIAKFVAKQEKKVSR